MSKKGFFFCRNYYQVIIKTEIVYLFSMLQMDPKKKKNTRNFEIDIWFQIKKKIAERVAEFS